MSTAPPGPPTGSPTPLLALVAGPFAERVAGVWPAPHADFLTASADRRHLVCLALHRGLPDPELLLGERLRLAVRTVVPNAPEGLCRCLGKLGETAWPGEDYEALVRLLRLPMTAKGLRHAARLSADEVRGLARLPSATLESRTGRVQLSSAQADLLAEVHAAIARSRGEVVAQTAARRWGKAASTRRLLEAALEELYPEPAPSPFPGSARLRPLASKAEIRAAGGRYRNCLAGQLGPAATGAAAFYEWPGPPPVAVELQRDPVFGWRLEQARIADNEAVPTETQAAIGSELRDWGVHVGRTAWQLEKALSWAGRSNFSFVNEAEAVGELFGE